MSRARRGGGQPDRPPMPEQTEFGRYLQHLREARRLSKLQLATRAGVNDAYLGQMEAGWTWRADAKPEPRWRQVRPSPPRLFALAAALGLDPRERDQLFILAGVDLPAALRQYSASTGQAGQALRPPASGGTFSDLSSPEVLAALAQLEQLVTAVRREVADAAQRDRDGSGRGHGDEGRTVEDPDEVPAPDRLGLEHRELGEPGAGEATASNGGA